MIDKKKVQKAKGFSLIELLVVATVISLLVGIGAVSYGAVTKSSRDAKRKSDLETIRSALEFYRSDTNYYPDDLDDLTEYLPVTPAEPKSAWSYEYCPITGTPPNNIDYDLCARLESAQGTSFDCCTGKGCGGSSTCNYRLTPLGEE